MKYTVETIFANGDDYKDTLDSWQKVLSYLNLPGKAGQQFTITGVDDPETEKFKTGDKVLGVRANIPDAIVQNVVGTLEKIDSREPRYLVQSVHGPIWYFDIDEYVEPPKPTIIEVLLDAPVGTQYRWKANVVDDGVIDDMSPIVLANKKTYSAREDTVKYIKDMYRGDERTVDMYDIKYPDGSTYGE